MKPKRHLRTFQYKESLSRFEIELSSLKHMTSNIFPRLDQASMQGQACIMQNFKVMAYHNQQNNNMCHK